jgi:hypothetical protein
MGDCGRLAGRVTGLIGGLDDFPRQRRRPRGSISLKIVAREHSTGRILHRDAFAAPKDAHGPDGDGRGKENGNRSTHDDLTQFLNNAPPQTATPGAHRRTTAEKWGIITQAREARHPPILVQM